MNKFLRTLFFLGFVLGMPVVAFSQQPVANFSANITSGCSPIVVQFSDLSTNTPTSWLWDLGNGTTSTLQNPSTTYIAAGTYTVTLTATNANGSNTKTITGYINVTAAPTVSFIANDTLPSCPPKTISFTNTSTPGVGGTTTYNWDFGDGTTSNLQNPSHTYTTTGNFTVTLIVTNSAGCVKSLTKTNYIPMTTKPNAAFTASVTGSCNAPLTTTFNNTTTGAVTYEWNFGDGSPISTQASPTHTYTAPGSYTVQLIATNAGGCKDTLIRTSYVSIGNLDASFTTSSTTACTNNPITFTNTTVPGPGNSTWYFGDGGTATTANATHNYIAAGTYTVKLVVQYANCSDSATQTVTITQGPQLSFTASPTTGCTVPFTTQFTNTTTGAASYAWDFGDGTTSTAAAPSHTYTSLGSYTVRLIATSANGCKDTLIKPNYIVLQNPVVTISATPAGGCIPFTSVFSVSSTATITSYSWTFGDGGTGTGSNPSHTYTTSGSFPVTLTYQTANGCTGTASIVVGAGTPPDASFTGAPVNVCPNQTVTFTNTSTGATSYAWLFGDGTTSTLANPTHAYSDPGTFTVRLIAYNGACADTFTIVNMITVSLPKSLFTWSINCANRKQVTFQNASVGASTHSWNFGDGNTSTALNPVHTYAANGNYAVTLTVTNANNGCTDVYTDTVRIYDITPQFTVSDTTVCRSENVFFTALMPASLTSNYTWSLGPVGYSGMSNPINYAYAASGIYTIKLVVTDKYGCKDSLIKPNHVRVGTPTVDFNASPLTGCPPLNVSFSSLSTPNGGFAITNYNWNFGDGVTLGGNNPNVSHLYANTGAYTVTLTATDANGCTGTLTKNTYITVSKPTAQFTADTSLCSNETVTFNNTSTGGTGLTYQWNFGDGGTSTATSPTHTYTTPGTYTVRLIATSGSGCSDTLIRTNYIHVYNVVAGFVASDTFSNCPPLAVNFTSTTTGASSYAWSFGNNATSNLTNPSTLYTFPGVYPVKLVVKNTQGCKDSVTKNITVLGPTGTFTYTPVNGCQPMTVTFTATTQNATTLVWDMNNGYTQSTTSNTFTYTYTQGGVFVPKLILSNGQGCNVAIQGQDTIRSGKATAGFSFTPNNICQAGTIQFTDTSSSQPSAVTTYSWSFGDGGTSTAQNPSHFYAGPGTYTVKLKIINAQGCADSVTHDVTINPAPVLSATGAQSVCSGGTAQLGVSGANTYSWSPAGTLSCTTCANPVATPSTATTYTVIGTNTFGCADTAQVTVGMHPQPAVSGGNGSTICSGNSTTLQATGGTSYTWTPATGLSCTNCANPTASPVATTTYTVTGTDANGCTDTGTVTVTVNQTPLLNPGTNQSVCNGASVQLQASGAATYSWSPATGLSCTNCANPVANPATTTTYTVTGSNGLCSATGQVTVTVTSQPVINAGADQNICVGGNATLQASGAQSYTWSPATGLSCTSCANPTASPTTTTTYTVTGIAAGGCSGSDQVTITIVAPPTVTAGADQQMCAGGSVALQASGATTYSWSPATGLSCTNCANPTANPATTTTYTVTGSTTGGCFNTDPVTVTVNPLPTVSAGGNKSVCSGAGVVLQGTGATTYSWSPSTGLSCTNCASPTATPSATTVYTLNGTDANGCSNSSQATVTVNPLPTITATNNQTICAGGSVALQAGGGVSYSWTPAAGLSCTNCANPTASPAATTTYTVTGMDANGCTNTKQVTVTVNPLPTANAGANQSICAGGSVQLIGTGGTTYNWTPATGLSCTNCSSPLANPATTTTYTLTATSTSGCTDTAMVTVTVNALPTISVATPPNICNGASAQLTATGGSSYSWSPATGLSCTNCANPTASPSATTTYTVTGTGANGCTNTTQVTVTLHPPAAISAGPDASVCSGTPANLAATGGTTYSWSPATGLSCTNCANPTANPATTTTYTVTGTNANGCTGTDQVTVNIGQLPTISAGADQVRCFGVAANLQATGGATYTWSPATGLSCTSCASPVATPLSTTTYTVTGANASGCTGTDQVTITVNPLPQVNAGADQGVCTGGSVTLNAGGAGTYNWSPATGLSCTNCTTPTASPAATTVYTLTGTDANGCTNSDQVTVTINPLPTVNAGPDQEICGGASASLQATGASTYNWTPAATLSCSNCPNPSATPATQTTYTVTGTDANGCSNTDAVTVSIVPRVPTSVGPGDTLCKGESAELSAAGGIGYEWTPAAGLSNPLIANPTATPAATTTYTVYIRENQCYTDTASITVIVNPTPTVNAGPDQQLVAGGSVTIFATATDATIYAWNPPTDLSCFTCLNPVASPKKTTTYTVDVSNEYGCRASDTVTIEVNCDNSQIFMPNTFTPNGDGQNDRFYPRGKGVGSISRLRIYNRWGELMYDVSNFPANDLTYGWDGSFKGQPLKPDVYVWVLEAKCESGAPMMMKGDISLVR